MRTTRTILKIVKVKGDVDIAMILILFGDSSKSIRIIISDVVCCELFNFSIFWNIEYFASLGMAQPAFFSEHSVSKLFRYY